MESAQYKHHCGYTLKHTSHDNENNVCIHTGDKNIHTMGSTMQRTENFTKYYFLIPPSAFAEGGSRIFRRGAKKMLEED